jgi:CRP-like cAMP-binding protein
MPGLGVDAGRSWLLTLRVRHFKRWIKGGAIRNPCARRRRILEGAASSAPPQRIAAFDPRLFLTKLTAGKTSREYKGGESVFSQGETADAVFYIHSGKVRLTVVSKRGKEAVVAILPEGIFFGEGCLADQPVRMATASIVQRSSIIRVAKPVMLDILHQEPEFAERFLAYLLSRSIRMEADRRPVFDRGANSNIENRSGSSADGKSRHHQSPRH